MCNTNTDKNRIIYSAKVPPISLKILLKEKIDRRRALLYIVLSLLIILLSPWNLWVILLRLLLLSLGYLIFRVRYYLTPYKVTFYDEIIVLDFCLFRKTWTRAFLNKDICFYYWIKSSMVKIQINKDSFSRFLGLGYFFSYLTSNWDSNSIITLVDYAKQHTNVISYNK